MRVILRKLYFIKGYPVFKSPNIYEKITTKLLTLPKNSNIIDVKEIN
jgi:hypothetical protein